MAKKNVTARDFAKAAGNSQKLSRLVIKSNKQVGFKETQKRLTRAFRMIKD